jgi:hypothetical protein
MIKNITTLQADAERKYEETLPDAERMIFALSHVGYKLEDSIADLVDNSVSANSSEVLIRFLHNGENIEEVLVADDGDGMTSRQLAAAMRFGSARSSESKSLGKFGLGLKLASFSYCDELLVCTRRGGKASARAWSTEGIASGWQCEVLESSAAKELLQDELAGLDTHKSGTIVTWRRLKNLPTHKRGIRSIIGLIERRLRLHLGMRFHRFIERGTLKIKMDQQLVGQKAVPYWVEVEALNPFAYEVSGSPLYPKKFLSGQLGDLEPLEFEAHIWPPNSQAPAYRLGKRASMYQGFFVYRKDRLIQAGGWLGLVNDDTEPHSSLARIRFDLPESAEETFGINVQKSTVVPPIGFHDAFRASTALDGTSWEEFRGRAIDVYRSAGGREIKKSFGLGRGFSKAAQSNDKGQIPLKLRWAKNEDAPLVELIGEALVFNPRLKWHSSELLSKTVLDALALTIVSNMSDAKSLQRIQSGSGILDPNLARAFERLLRTK